jgi:hypothetical protein
LEFEPSKVPAKVRKALSSIEERLKLPLLSGSAEYQALQDANSGTAALSASVPKMGSVGRKARHERDDLLVAKELRCGGTRDGFGSTAKSSEGRVEVDRGETGKTHRIWWNRTPSDCGGR